MFLLIDIDNTLYKYSETGFDIEIKSLIVKFIHEATGLSMEKIKALPWEHHLSNGISLIHFLKEYDINVKDFTNYMHQCSYHKLTANAPLKEMLNRMQGRGGMPTRSHEKNDNIFGENDACASSLNTIDCGDKKRHYLYFFTNANRSHARRVLEALGLKSVFTRRPQPASPTRHLHYSYDVEGFEEDVDWVGFSYEDQWRLTEPEIANKPARRAYEAIFRALEEDIVWDAMQWSITSATTDFSFPDVKAVALADDFLSFPHKETLNDMNNYVDGVVVHENCNRGREAKRAQQALLHKRMSLRPDRIVMVDDLLTNLREPLLLGWKAVWCVPGEEKLPEDELYQKAYQKGLLKTIDNILDLEKTIDAWREDEL